MHAIRAMKPCSQRCSLARSGSAIASPQTRQDRQCANRGSIGNRLRAAAATSEPLPAGRLRDLCDCGRVAIGEQQQARLSRNSGMNLC